MYVQFLDPCAQPSQDTKISYDCMRIRSMHVVEFVKVYHNIRVKFQPGKKWFCANDYGLCALDDK